MHIGPELKVLRDYKPSLPEAPNFDEFWKSTIEHFGGSGDVQFVKWQGPLNQVEVFDVTVPGFNNDPIKGWFIHPKGASGVLPCVVTFEGYGGGRGLPHEWLFWPTCGYAVLVMDTRGQGSGHRRGDTPDGAYPSPSQTPGFMTKGIASPDTYFYRRVYTDAVSFVRAAANLPGVDPTRIIVAGASQGGGIAIAAAGLCPEIFAAMPDVPFLCHMQRAVEITDSYPYQELALYLRAHRNEVEQTWKTIAYFDGMNFAARAKSPTLFSVGLHDPICPPETVFAAFNHWAGEKRVEVWPYGMHEGGGVDQHLVQADWLKALLKGAEK